MPLLLLAIAMAPRAHAEYWCPPGGYDEARARGECIGDASPAKVKAFKQAWYDARKREASALSVDFEDIVFAYLADGARSAKSAYCLVLFDDRPSAGLTRRLRRAHQNPLYCRTGVANSSFVYRISQLTADTFLLNTGYYCGPLCAGEHFVTMRRNEDGTFVIEKTEELWIS